MQLIDSTTIKRPKPFISMAPGVTTVLRERPPMFLEITRKFRVIGKGAIFCWGDKIYNPEAIEITRELFAHEAVHARQQGNDPEGWWRQYITCPKFRLAQEIPAHVAEYREFKRNYASTALRKEMLKQIARRLASPLYGSLISQKSARRAIEAAS